MGRLQTLSCRFRSPIWGSRSARELAASFQLLALLLVGCGAEESETVEVPGDRAPDGGSAIAEQIEIEPGVPLTRRPASGGDVATLDLGAGHRLRATADQTELDLVLSVEDPGGRTVAVDLPVGRAGPELLCFVAGEAGRHRLVVRPVAPGSESHYTLKVEVGPATAADRRCAEAIVSLAEGRSRQAEGDLAAARALFEQSRDSAQAAAEPLLEAVARFQGAELAVRRGDLELAVDEGDLARQRITGLGWPRLEVEWRNRTGLVERRRGRVDAARRRFSEALERARAEADRAGQATSLHNLGRLAQDRADLPRAMASYRQALELWHGLGRPVDHARTLSFLASVHSQRTQLAEARDLLAEALEILPAGERTQRSDVLVQLGWVHYLSEDPEAALASYRRALDLLDASAPALDRAGVLDRMGTAERQRGRFAAAQGFYSEALRVLAGDGSQGEAHVEGNLGELYLEWGRLEAARSHLERAAAAFRRFGDDNALAHMLTSLARLERLAARPEPALELLEEAVELSDGLWRKAFEQGDLARPTALIQDIDSLYVDLLMELDARNPAQRFARRAFERSDAARDRNLLTLVGAPPAPESAAAAELRARDVRLRSEIEDLEARRSRSPGAELDRRLRLELLALDEVQRAIRARTLARGALPPPLDMARLQAALPGGVCLLSYALGETRSHLFVLCPGGLESHRLPARESLESQAQALVQALSISDQARPRAQSTAALQAMAEVLLGPVEHRLPALRRLVVVPEGALADVPFGALPGPSGEPLLARRQVVQGPSAGVLAALAARAEGRRERRRRIAILADPVYASWDPRCAGCRRSSSAPGARGWARLPGSAAEGRAIRDLAPAESRLYLGFEADREGVLRGALRDATLVHIAAHGHLDDRVPSSSGIVLSRFDAAGRPREGILSIRDIRTLELEADLAVLSACRSAWGRPIRGDALLGMAQAFFVAGASQLLVSLWEVDDRATAALMTEFYRQLLVAGAPAAEALRRAQGTIRSTAGWEAPFYWAGFVLLHGWR